MQATSDTVTAINSAGIVIVTADIRELAAHSNNTGVQSTGISITTSGVVRIAGLISFINNVALIIEAVVREWAKRTRAGQAIWNPLVQTSRSRITRICSTGISIIA